MIDCVSVDARGFRSKRTDISVHVLQIAVCYFGTKVAWKGLLPRSYSYMSWFHALVMAVQAGLVCAFLLNGVLKPHMGEVHTNGQWWDIQILKQPMTRDKNLPEITAEAEW